MSGPARDAPAGDEAPEPPLDTATLQRIGGSRGSNPGGVWQDAQGQRYYVKTLESPALAANEWLAAQLYRLAGVPTLHYRRSSQPGQVITRWQPLVCSRLAQFNPAQRAQAAHALGVHAWLANWDAVGLHGDNLGVDPAGRVLALDLGGALRFRAQGDPKGAAFGPVVGEIERLRHDPDNPQARQLFGAMDDAALGAAIAVVTRLPADAIVRTVQAHAGGGTPAGSPAAAASQARLAERLCALLLARQASLAAIARDLALTRA